MNILCIIHMTYSRVAFGDVMEHTISLRLRTNAYRECFWKRTKPPVLIDVKCKKNSMLDYKSWISTLEASLTCVSLQTTLVTRLVCVAI